LREAVRGGLFHLAQRYDRDWSLQGDADTAGATPPPSRASGENAC
jgi:hypothetical protein